jgi:hypothetical protein
MSTDFTKPLRRLAPTATPEVDAEANCATFLFNDERPDARDSHIVRTAGIDVTNFRANPIILFCHIDSEPPVARATDITTQGTRAFVTMQFTPRDLYEFGALVGRLVAARYLNAVSESWRPVTYKRRTDGVDGYDFLTTELLEISVCTLPALPQAVATARVAGVDVEPMRKWAEQHLDRASSLGVDRGELLMLRRAAAGRSQAFSLPVAGRDRRAAIARELAERGQRLDIVTRLQAKAASQLPAASREALEATQGHLARCERHRSELSRRHERLAENVDALPGIHRALKRALSAAGVPFDEYGIAKAVRDLEQCGAEIGTDHDGATTACQDLGTALGLAASGVDNVISGVAELDE